MMNDKITGLDLAVPCDAYDEFADYCEQFFATAAENYNILNRNIDIIQRNIAKAIRNYKLDEACECATDHGTSPSGAALAEINILREVNLEDFNVLRERVEQFRNELTKINRISQSDLENNIERFGMFQDLFENSVRYISFSLKSYSSEKFEEFEELEEFEQFPAEPEPPKW